MANLFGLGLMAPGAIRQPQAKYRRASVRSCSGVIAITTALLVNEKIYIGRLPANAIIKPGSTVIHEAFGGTTTLAWGFLDETPAGALNCLGAAQPVATAGAKNGMVSVPVANMSREAWRLAGLAADPGRELILGFTLQTAVVTTPGNLYYSFDFCENI